jgi:hypothetical protein
MEGCIDGGPGLSTGFYLRPPLVYSMRSDHGSCDRAPVSTVPCFRSHPASHSSLPAATFSNRPGPECFGYPRTASR